MLAGMNDFLHKQLLCFLMIVDQKDMNVNNSSIVLQSDENSFGPMNEYFPVLNDCRFGRYKL